MSLCPRCEEGEVFVCSTGRRWILLPISKTKDERVCWHKDVIASYNSIADELEKIAETELRADADFDDEVDYVPHIVVVLRKLAKELREEGE